MRYLAIALLLCCTGCATMGTQAPPPDAGFLTGYQIILADDEMRTVYRLSDDLAQLGMAPQVVRTVPELLDLATTISATCLLLVNPWFGGSEPEKTCLAELRAALGTPESPIIALVPEHRAKDVDGADAVLTKPVEITELLQACHAALSAEGVAT